MNIQEAKNKAAQEAGYQSYESAHHFGMAIIYSLTDRAMQIYADAEAKDFGEYLMIHVNTERIDIEEAEEVSKRYYKIYQNNQK